MEAPKQEVKTVIKTGPGASLPTAAASRSTAKFVESLFDEEDDGGDLFGPNSKREKENARVLAEQAREKEIERLKDLERQQKELEEKQKKIEQQQKDLEERERKEKERKDKERVEKEKQLEAEKKKKEELAKQEAERLKRLEEFKNIDMEEANSKF